MRHERAEACSRLRDRKHLDRSEPEHLGRFIRFRRRRLKVHGHRSAALECVLSRTAPRNGLRYFEAVPSEEDARMYGIGVGVAI